MKQGLVLDRVVLLGRTLDEYVRYFALDLKAWRGAAVLDVGSGVSSFCAEANEQDLQITACDPIYALSWQQIQQRCEPDLDYVTNAIGNVKTYRWDFYKSPENLRTYRERAYRKFLENYQNGRGIPYVAGLLPKLPFPGDQFDLTLVSYFLFVYEDQFDYQFHKQSILEIMRVTRGEARLYPLVSFEAKRCPYLDPLRADPELERFRFEEVQTDFEFLAGSNWFLRIQHER
jgi:hypothetical protein